jgi:hypothetical protein
MSKLEIDSDEDNWRLVCPNGHTSVAPTNNHFWCRSCANHWDPEVDPEYDVVIDGETGEKYSRDDLELDFTAPGVYHA